MQAKSELIQKGRYSFEWHYILTDQNLTHKQLKILDNILSFFPRNALTYLPAEFLSFNPSDYDQNLLSLAANALDNQGDPVLNIVAQHGQPSALQKLLDLGANPDSRDCLEYLPLHWVMYNMFSNPKNVLEGTRCLLNAGAQNIASDIIETPLQFALEHKHTEAAFLIQTHQQRTNAFKIGATRGMFKGLFSADITNQISTYNDSQTVTSLALTCTHMLIEGKKEVKKCMDEFRALKS